MGQSGSISTRRWLDVLNPAVLGEIVEIRTSLAHRLTCPKYEDTFRGFIFINHEIEVELTVSDLLYAIGPGFACNGVPATEAFVILALLTWDQLVVVSVVVDAVFKLSGFTHVYNFEIFVEMCIVGASRFCIVGNRSANVVRCLLERLRKHDTNEFPIAIRMLLIARMMISVFLGCEPSSNIYRNVDSVGFSLQPARIPTIVIKSPSVIHSLVVPGVSGDWIIFPSCLRCGLRHNISYL